MDKVIFEKSKCGSWKHYDLSAFNEHFMHTPTPENISLTFEGSEKLLKNQISYLPTTRKRRQRK